jgi:NTE family protein
MNDSKQRHGSGSQRHKIALALQGGGSHGAFTWGVLDRLLEDPTLEVIGLTGTSAGAMNAVVVADGLLRGGPEGARQRLHEFWNAIGKMPGFGAPLSLLSGEAQSKVRLEQTPAYVAWDAVSRNLSPYQLNPMNFNPLREPLTKLVDFERLRAEQNLRIFVCATNALSARRRVFDNRDISVDAVLASACLPYVFPSVMIDGEPYWDGGYTGNPAMSAMLPPLPKSDVIIVRIDPIIRNEEPRTVREIHDRVTEVSFNSTFWLELSHLGFLLALKERGFIDDQLAQRFDRLKFHCIEASQHFERIPASTKLNNSSAFLKYLFDLGRVTADAWLDGYREALGRRSTLDLTKFVRLDLMEEADQLIRRSGVSVASAAAREEKESKHFVAGR